MMMETTRKEIGTVICSGDVAQAMIEKRGAKEIEDILNLFSLCLMAEEDREMRDMYLVAVVKATGDKSITGAKLLSSAYRIEAEEKTKNSKEDFDNFRFSSVEMVYRNRHLKYKNMLQFAARNIISHNTFVRKKTGLTFLTKMYDLKKVADCEELIKEFQLYAILTAGEVKIDRIRKMIAV